MSLGYIVAGFAPNFWVYALAQGTIGRRRHIRLFRPVDDRHLALVRAPARHRGRDLRLGQLYRRPAVAGPAATFHRDRRLARNPYRGRHHLPGHDLAAGADLQTASAPAHGQFQRRGAKGFHSRARSGISPNALQAILCVAGVACCVAMAMPQVHIVAYCGDLGYGVARGAEMLSLMLGFGIVSRILSGVIADRIGGVGTLLIGSALQGSALILYFLFNGLTSLYVISAMFGLFQGGIVPSYAIIVREYFPPEGSRRPARPGADGDAIRHGAWRLDVGPDFRYDRLLSRRFCQRHCVESAQCLDRGLAYTAARPARPRIGASVITWTNQGKFVMSLSMYQASVPAFLQVLGALSGVLDKAIAHAAAKKIDQSVFSMRGWRPICCRSCASFSLPPISPKAPLGALPASNRRNSPTRKRASRSSKPASPRPWISSKA